MLGKILGKSILLSSLISVVLLAVLTLSVEAGKPTPIISSVSPEAGSTIGGTIVTILGTGFGKTVGTVKFGDVEVYDYISWADSKIVCEISPHAAGPVKVEVTTSKGLIITKSSGFTYIDLNPPVIDSVSPDSGPTSGGTIVTILGANFVSGTTGHPTVWFGDDKGFVESINYESFADSQIVCITPKHAAGPVTVRVIADNGLIGDRPAGFTYRDQYPPVVDSVSPNSGPTIGGTIVTILGANFVSGTTGHPTVWFGDDKNGYVESVNYISFADSQIVCVTPPHAAGKVTVKVIADNGLSGIKRSAFTYKN